MKVSARAELKGNVSDWQGCHGWLWIWKKPSAKLEVLTHRNLI